MAPISEVIFQNYKTVPRRFQQWCRGEVLRGILVDLGNSLREEDTCDELECFIDATVAALQWEEVLESEITYVSTGGGTALLFIGGEKMPGLSLLTDLTQAA